MNNPMQDRALLSGSRYFLSLRPCPVCRSRRARVIDGQCLTCNVPLSGQAKLVAKEYVLRTFRLRGPGAYSSLGLANALSQVVETPTELEALLCIVEPRRKPVVR